MRQRADNCEVALSPWTCERRRRIKEKLGNYVRMYILCDQCNAPDTRFLKEDRTTLLKCQACGATRPVKM